MARTTTRRPAPPARHARLWLIVGGVAVTALILAVALSAGESGDTVAADVTLTGDELPRFDATAPDAAVGLVAPEVTGESYTGDPVAIEADGVPKAIIFLTHW